VVISIDIKFEYVHQISQVLSGDDRHMVSRVFFEINVTGANRFSTFADVKQIVGGDFEKHPLEVSRPSMYRMAWNQNAFRDLVETYYRQQIGPTGVGINVPGTSTGQMTNNKVWHSMSASLQASEDPSTW
jgi:hypothetical protein